MNNSPAESLSDDKKLNQIQFDVHILNELASIHQRLNILVALLTILCCCFILFLLWAK